MGLPLAQTQDQIEFWNKLQPVNRVASSDTYKRTMSGSSDLFANNFACYSLAARRGLNEEGANGRYVMAGLEKMLYPWFANPISQKEVNVAKNFFENKASVNKFPAAAWQAVLDNDGFLPVDIYSLPGGQTFLAKDGKHVPMMSVEGIGALVTHLEPHLENIYAPLIQATKAKLFHEATGNQFAEFGLRSDQNENNHATLMMALYVGGGFRNTSNDQAVMLFPKYFDDIGTMGHEFIMAYQKGGLSLEEAQRQAFEDFVEMNERSALLPDVIDTLNSGLPAILDLVKKYSGTSKVIMPRFDSGKVTTQCIAWKNITLESGISEIKMVVEDGYTPTKARETKNTYATAGFNPQDIIVGAGGYFQDGCSRDVASLVYKRSATMHDSGLEASMKFSDSPGKESVPGQIRIYGKDNVIVVAQKGEEIDGEPLMVKVVDNGKIVYNENLEVQHQRALDTWNQYTDIEYSSATLEIIAKRTDEKEVIFGRI